MMNPEFEDFRECLSTEGDLVHLTLPDRTDTLCGKPLKAGEPAEGQRPCPLCRHNRRELSSGRAAGADVHRETGPPYQA